MKTIPTTSPDKYVTGFDALNIPLGDGTSADWHFHAAFIESSSAARIAGIDWPSTNHLFGRYDVRECGVELRRCGHVGDAGEVWAAGFVRAILDLVYCAVTSGSRPDHVDVDDLLDHESDRRELAAWLADLKASVPDRAKALVEEWEARQEWTHR